MKGQQDVKQVLADSIYILDLINKSEKVAFRQENEIGISLLKSIENESFATIRSGGPSVLSTMLHRGMASRHIAVLWSGFNIQSVVNGTFDLGLIRNTFDRNKFYQNGTTAATGNASMAGALSLENNVFKKNSTHINLSFTSAKNTAVTILNKLRYKKYNHHLAINYTSDKNQYSFIKEKQKIKQQNAAFSIWDINYESHYLFDEKWNLNTGVWLQNAERNIPPTKTSVFINQEQEDKNYRGFIQLAYYPTNRSKLKLRSAYFNELIDYQAPGISSQSMADIYNTALDYTHDMGLNLSAQYRRDNVNASFFDPTLTRNTIALLADFQSTIQTAGIIVGASLRPEWVDSKLQPLIIGVKAKKQFSKSIDVALLYNKGYTLPSFNDLYWPQGGNPDLQTEKSHEFDFGFNYQYGISRKKSLSFNLYFNLIDNWIQWTPIDGFFQPINQRKVRNLGFELKLVEEFKLSEHTTLKTNLQYGFTDSRLLRHYLTPDNEGKHSIFIPSHKFSGNISIEKKSWKFNLLPVYYSKRYDTVDNSSFVPGFLIVDFELIKEIKIKDHKLNLSFAAENALNNDYENIRFFPMPLRIFRFSINYQIQ